MNEALPAADQPTRTVLAWVSAADAVAASAAELAGGWRVRRVGELRAMQLAVARDRPDVLLVDLTDLPDDPHRCLRTLRADFKVAGVPLVALVPEPLSAAELVAFGDLVDDYVRQPWSAGELAHRLEWAVARHGERNAMAAVTGLPGFGRARQDLQERLAAGRPFGYCRLDLDGFAAFNEIYGHPRGDQLIAMFAATLRRVAADLAPPPFVGHLDGDDFVLTCAADQARPACRDVADMFEADSLTLYDEAERVRGTMQVTDRRGVQHDIPLVTVSAGVATNEHRHFANTHQVLAVADEMLVFAKQSAGSSVGVDRRKA
ncbi:MAG: diguanylate cyclase [Streptosporangiales bacterium]|nr:diguanylate cyclase [Streptosporangiales bacterium]